MPPGPAVTGPKIERKNFEQILPSSPRFSLWEQSFRLLSSLVVQG